MSIRPEIKKEYIKHLSSIFSDFNYDYKLSEILNYGLKINPKNDDCLSVIGSDSILKVFEDTNIIKAIKTYKGNILYKLEFYQVKSLIESFFEKIESGIKVDYAVKFEDSSINFNIIVDFDANKDKYMLIIRKDSISITYLIDDKTGNLYFSYSLSNRSSRDIKLSISNIFNGEEYETPNVFVLNKDKITIREFTILKDEIEGVTNHYRSGDLSKFNNIMLNALDNTLDSVYKYQIENVTPTVNRLIPDLSTIPTFEGIDSKLFISEIFKAIKNYQYSLDRNIIEPNMEFPNIVVIGDKVAYIDFQFDDTNWGKYNFKIKFISSKDMPGKDIYHLFKNVYIPLIRCDNKYKIDFYDHDLIINAFITWVELSVKSDISVSKQYTFITDYEVREEAYNEWKDDIERDKADPISVMLGIKKEPNEDIHD